MVVGGLSMLAIGLTLVLVVATLRGSVRSASDRWARFFEDEVKPWLLPARHLDLLRLQRRMVVAGLSAVTISVAGERYLPRQIVIEVSASDRHRLASEIESGLDRVCADLATEISRRATKRGCEVQADMVVTVTASALVRDGRPIRSAVLGRPPQPDVETAPASEQASLSDTASLEARTGSPTPSCGTVGPSSAGPIRLDPIELVPVTGGEPVKVAGQRVRVGRRGADVNIDDPTVSVDHAELTCEQGVWTIADRHSANGTYVNGRPVRRKELVDGDRLQFAIDGPEFVLRLPVDPQARTLPLSNPQRGSSTRRTGAPGQLQVVKRRSRG